MIGRDRVVHQRDLGPKTADGARAITAFDQDEGWQKVDEVDQISKRITGFPREP